jgi:hypothetical protein
MPKAKQQDNGETKDLKTTIEIVAAKLGSWFYGTKNKATSVAFTFFRPVLDSDDFEVWASAFNFDPDSMINAESWPAFRRALLAEIFHAAKVDGCSSDRVKVDAKHMQNIAYAKTNKVRLSWKAESVVALSDIVALFPQAKTPKEAVAMRNALAPMMGTKVEDLPAILNDLNANLD